MSLTEVKTGKAAPESDSLDVQKNVHTVSLSGKAFKNRKA